MLQVLPANIAIILATQLASALRFIRSTSERALSDWPRLMFGFTNVVLTKPYGGCSSRIRGTRAVLYQ
jgi:hypothetical protein